MKKEVSVIVSAMVNVALLAGAAVAGPPGPPLIVAPAVPVGGPEVGIATALAVTAYGIWKSRK